MPFHGAQERKPGAFPPSERRCRPSRVRLAILAVALVEVLAPIPDSHSCLARGEEDCLDLEESSSAGETLPEEEALQALLVADDGVRMQLATALPRRAISKQTLLNAPLSTAGLALLTSEEADEERDTEDAEEGSSAAGGTVALTLAFNGVISWHLGESIDEEDDELAPLQSMGNIQEGVGRVTAHALGRKGRVLALGHARGDASVWHLSRRVWERVALVRNSHHEWEKVVLVAVSSDGGLLLACTADNAVLWRVAGGDHDRGSGDHDSGSREPEADSSAMVELRHLHGGAFQVAAADIGRLPRGGAGFKRYFVAVAYKSGVFEGWAVGPTTTGESTAASKGANQASMPAQTVPERGASKKGGAASPDLWHLPRRGEPRLVAVVATALPRTSGPEAALATAADAEGRIMLWQLNAEGKLLQEKPLWEVSPWSSPASALATCAWREADASKWRVAAGFRGQVLVLEGSTGRTLHTSTFSGGVVALRWR